MSLGLRRHLLPQKPHRVQPDVSLAIVNIVLLLILFFLATGALVNAPPTGVDLSETRDLPIDQLPKPVLAVEPDGSLILDGMPVLAADLPRDLAGQSLLHLLIDRSAPAQDLVDLLTQPGLDSLEIRLVTIHRRDEP